MASFREDLFDAHNPAPSVNLTPEVGSGQLKVMQEKIAALREQIETLTQKPKEQVPRVEPQEISRPFFYPEKLSLPRFNPELAGSDPAATVGAIMEKRLLQGDELYITISRALERTAVQWFTHVPVHGLT
jgi:hypothetical protein